MRNEALSRRTGCFYGGISVCELPGEWCVYRSIGIESERSKNRVSAKPLSHNPKEDSEEERGWFSSPESAPGRYTERP